MKGVNPAWANLPRRHCDDCGKSYKPKQPLRPNTRGFCSDTCRKSYHKHGGAYRKLRVEMKKLIERRFKEVAETVRKLAEPIFQDAVEGIVARQIKEADLQARQEIHFLKRRLDKLEAASGIEIAVGPTERAVRAALNAPPAKPFPRKQSTAHARNPVPRPPPHWD